MSGCPPACDAERLQRAVMLEVADARPEKQCKAALASVLPPR